MKQQGFSPIIILVLIAIAAAGYFGFTHLKTSIVKFTPTPTSSSTPSADSTANWKTYTNTKYGFQLTYPANGISDTKNEIACGNHVTEKVDSTLGNYIEFDGFFVIRIIPWQKIINDYISEQQATGLYNLESITGTGAVEAVAIKGLKNNWDQEGYPPMAYDEFIYRTDNQLFIIMGRQDPGTGCNPFNKSGSSLTPVEWDIAKSFKFN
jgi:hypothetical protein